MIQITEAGQPCRHCSTPVIWRSPKRRSPRRQFWYSQYLYCPSCKALYLRDQDIIPNPKFQRAEELASELEDGFQQSIVL